MDRLYSRPRGQHLPWPEGPFQIPSDTQPLQLYIYNTPTLRYNLSCSLHRWLSHHLSQLRKKRKERAREKRRRRKKKIGNKSKIKEKRKRKGTNTAQTLPSNSRKAWGTFFLYFFLSFPFSFGLYFSHSLVRAVLSWRSSLELGYLHTGCYLNPVTPIPLPRPKISGLEFNIYNHRPVLKTRIARCVRDKPARETIRS